MWVGWMSQVKAGSAYVELTTKNSKLMKGLADAQKRLQAFGAATGSASISTRTTRPRRKIGAAGTSA